MVIFNSYVKLPEGMFTFGSRLKFRTWPWAPHGGNASSTMTVNICFAAGRGLARLDVNPKIFCSVVYLPPWKIWKSMGSWEGWHPIYEMEHQIQDIYMILYDFICAVLVLPPWYPKWKHNKNYIPYSDDYPIKSSQILSDWWLTYPLKNMKVNGKD